MSDDSWHLLRSFEFDRQRKHSDGVGGKSLDKNDGFEIRKLLYNNVHRLQSKEAGQAAFT